MNKTIAVFLVFAVFISGCIGGQPQLNTSSTPAPVAITEPVMSDVSGDEFTALDSDLAALEELL